jgi:hypothetical protein
MDLLSGCRCRVPPCLCCPEPFNTQNTQPLFGSVSKPVFIRAVVAPNTSKFEKLCLVHLRCLKPGSLVDWLEDRVRRRQPTSPPPLMIFLRTLHALAYTHPVRVTT